MPPGLTSLVAALPLMLGSHELAHDKEAGRLGVPMGWENRSGNLPGWKINTKDANEIARIAGAGFRGQDAVAKALDGMDLGQAYRFLSALNKLGYIAFPAGLGSSKLGDVDTMNKAIGKSGLQAGLAGSALGDIYKAYNPKSPVDINFWQSERGTPGLAVEYKW